MTAGNILKPLVIAFYGIFVLGFCLAAHPTFAENDGIIYQPDPDSPIEARNPGGPEELSQYDFLIGDWDVDMTWYFDGKTPTKSFAKWHNHWIINGNAVMLEWRGPQFTGAEIRQWDAGKGHWVGVNIYPDFGTHMPAVKSYKDGENMLVFMDVQSPDGAYINRETYYDIEADSYKMKSDHSYDGGKTWERGLYEMTVRRAAQ